MSHRWHAVEHPDVSGEQLEVILQPHQDAPPTPHQDAPTTLVTGHPSAPERAAAAQVAVLRLLVLAAASAVRGRGCDHQDPPPTPHQDAPPPSGAGARTRMRPFGRFYRSYTCSSLAPRCSSCSRSRASPSCPRPILPPHQDAPLPLVAPLRCSSCSRSRPSGASGRLQRRGQPTPSNHQDAPPVPPLTSGAPLYRRG